MIKLSEYKFHSKAVINIETRWSSELLEYWNKRSLKYLHEYDGGEYPTKQDIEQRNKITISNILTINRLVENGVTNTKDLVNVLHKGTINLQLDACLVIRLLLIEPLYKHLHQLACYRNSDVALRVCAVKHLGELHRKRSRKLFIKILTDQAEHILLRIEAAYSLRWVRKLEDLALLLKLSYDINENDLIRGACIETIAYLHWEDETLAPLIVDLLDDESAEVRFWCLFAMAVYKYAPAIPKIEKIAATEHRVVEGLWEVSKEAMDALFIIKEDCEGYPDDEYKKSHNDFLRNIPAVKNLLKNEDI